MPAGDPPEDWSPDKERDEDPAKLTKEAIELQKEGLAYLKSLKANMNDPVRVYQPPPTKSLGIQIKKITNGWILTKVPGHGGIYPEDSAEQTYFAKIEELVAGLERVVLIFAADALGGGCPTGPAGAAGTPGKPYPGVGSDVPEGT